MREVVPSAMVAVESDYAAIVAALQSQKLPAYVTYTEDAYARGMGNGTDAPPRLTVDSRTNQIVGGNEKSANTPPTKRLFDPRCYSATAERPATWDGRRVTKIDVAVKNAACESDIRFTHIYGDPSTGELLAAEGDESESGVGVNLTIRYARVAQYVLPTSVEAHAQGHGWLFWVRQNAAVHYSDYSFDSIRRQSP